MRPRVTFGETDRDMQGEFLLKLGIKLRENLNYVLYDEFNVYAEGDMSID